MGKIVKAKVGEVRPPNEARVPATTVYEVWHVYGDGWSYLDVAESTESAHGLQESCAAEGQETIIVQVDLPAIPAKKE